MNNYDTFYRIIASIQNAFENYIQQIDLKILNTKNPFMMYKCIFFLSIKENIYAIEFSYNDDKDWGYTISKNKLIIDAGSFSLNDKDSFNIGEILINRLLDRR